MSSSSRGEPTAYIVGEEGGGRGRRRPALRRGHHLLQERHEGADILARPLRRLRFRRQWLARSLVLVYNSDSPSDLHDIRFAGVEGSAYLIGGIGVNYEAHEDIVLAPISTGVGARLGANVGYLKYTRRADLEPLLTGSSCRYTAIIFPVATLGRSGYCPGLSSAPAGVAGCDGL